MDTDFLPTLTSYLVDLIPKLAGAIVTLIIGLIVIRYLGSLISRLMERREVDASLQPFLKSIFKVALTALLIVSVASMVGIRTTSFVAIIGAAGLAVGLALQGSLANFAGGVLLLLLKPFRVGDYVTAQGYSGTVTEIQVFYTTLYTPQNQKIVLPNGGVANGAILNYSAEPTRRLDFPVGISYSEDIDKARSVLKEVFEQDERVLKEPEPEYLVDGLGDNAVMLKVRAWANLGDFWPLYFDVHEKVKKAFDENGITIPFPQRDVHLYQ